MAMASIYGSQEEDDDTQQKAGTSLQQAANPYGGGSSATQSATQPANQQPWKYKGGSVFNPAAATSQSSAPGARAQPATAPSLSLAPTGGYGGGGGGQDNGLSLAGYSPNLGTNIPNPVKDQFVKWMGMDPKTAPKTPDPSVGQQKHIQGIAGDFADQAGLISDQFKSFMSNPLSKLKDHLGKSDAVDSLDKIIESAGLQYSDVEKILEKLKGTDNTYLGEVKGNIDQYQGTLDEREKAARDQKTATGGYLDQIMGRAQSDYANADQYKGYKVDWSDPNNGIATDVRQLYEDQAQGARKQGLADVGVLSALGGQAMGSQIAGQPMTGGQLQAMAGGVQNRAGEAYRIAQQRMQTLRDQGLEQGFARTDAARSRYEDSRDFFSGQTEKDYGIRKDMDDSIAAVGSERLGVNNYADELEHRLGTSQSERELGATNAKYGTQQAAYAGKAELLEAIRTGDLQAITAILSKTIGAIPEYMKAGAEITKAGAEVAKVPAAYIPGAGG